MCSGREAGGVEGAESVPVAGGGLLVVGGVVGNGEAVPGRVELDRVVDAGVGQGAVQQGGLVGGERVVGGGAGHVDGGGDAGGGQVRAGRVVGHGQAAAVERRGGGNPGAESAGGDQGHAAAEAVAGGADRGPGHLGTGQQEVGVGSGVGDDPVAGQGTDQAAHPGPLGRVGEQGGGVERGPVAGPVVGVRDQCDVAQVGQPVAEPGERLAHAAGVGIDQHAGPRAVAARAVPVATVPDGYVQGGAAAAIGGGNLDVQAHSVILRLGSAALAGPV